MASRVRGNGVGRAVTVGSAVTGMGVVVGGMGDDKDATPVGIR